MLPFPTGDANIDSLSSAAGRWAQRVEDTDALARWMLYAALRLSKGDVGVVLFRPSVPFSLTTVGIVYVSDVLLDLLEYADQAAYVAAVAQSDFIHVDDQLVSSQHIVNGSSVLYDIRIKKGNGSGYKWCRVEGLLFAFGGITYRLTMIQAK